MCYTIRRKTEKETIPMTRKENLIIILAMVILMTLVMIALADAGVLTTEVETYAFTGTVTDKETSTHLMYNTKNIVTVHRYTITVVDGTETCTINIDSNTYDNISINDLVTIDATIRENLIGEMFITYTFRG